MTEIWKGIKWTIGIAIGFGIIVGVVIGGFAIFDTVQSEDGTSGQDQTEKQTQKWLEDCISREYRISKNDFRFEYMLNDYTVCHAERDGVQVPLGAPSGDPAKAPRRSR